MNTGEPATLGHSPLWAGIRLALSPVIRRVPEVLRTGTSVASSVVRADVGAAPVLQRTLVNIWGRRRATFFISQCKHSALHSFQWLFWFLRRLPASGAARNRGLCVNWPVQRYPSGCFVYPRGQMQRCVPGKFTHFHSHLSCCLRSISSHSSMSEMDSHTFTILQMRMCPFKNHVLDIF